MHAGIQAKLNMGEPGDKFEQEADQTADSVMSKPLVQKVEFAPVEEGVQSKSKAVQRNEEEQLQTMPGSEENTISKKSFLQTSSATGEKEFQPKEEEIDTKPEVQRALEKEEAPVAGKKSSDDKTVDPIAAGTVGTGMANPDSKFLLETTSTPTAYGGAKEEKVSLKSFVQQKADIQPELNTEKEDIPNDFVNAKHIQRAEEENLKPPTKTENQKNLKTLRSENEKLQLKGEGSSQPDAGFESSLKSSKGGGKSMPDETKSEMESRFGGRDFGNVKIHTDSTAQSMNKQINAKAFTNESDIYFNSGQFDGNSSGGKSLLAHELTHTIQQGASGESSGDAVQAQFKVPIMPPDKKVEKEDTSGDGDKADEKTSERIAEDVDQEEIDEKMSEPVDKEEASDFDRSEAKDGQDELVDTGAVDPVKDRPGGQKGNIETSKQNLAQGINAKPTTDEGDGKEQDVSLFNLAAADATRVDIMLANIEAESVPFPKEPEAVVEPELKRAKDSAGDWLPANAENDMKLIHLTNYAQKYREIGYQLQIEAYQAEVESHRATAAVGEVQEKVDTTTAYEQGAGIRVEEWQGYNDDLLKPAVQVAQEKAQWTFEEAGKLGAKAGGEMGNSASLAGESEEQQKEVDDQKQTDPEAMADSGDISDGADGTAEGAIGIFDAFTASKQRADQQVVDSEQAFVDNAQTEENAGQIDTDLAEGRSLLEQMRAQNSETQTQLDENAGTPAEILKASTETAKSGDELIRASQIIESEMHGIQTEYYSEMGAVPSKEQAEEQAQKEQQSGSQAEEIKPEDAGEEQFTPEEMLVCQLAIMSAEEQDELLSEMTDDEVIKLQLTLQEMEDKQAAMEEAQAAQAEQDANAGGISHTDAKSGRTILNFNEEKSSQQEEQEALERDPRANLIGAIESSRALKLQRPIRIVDQNYSHLTMLDKENLHSKLARQAFWNQMSNIKFADVPGILFEMFTLTSIKAGLVDNVSQIATGAFNLFNPEAWKKDPLGNLLTSGADISEGLTKLFVKGVIAAGVVWALGALMIVLTWGFSAPLNLPIMIWLKTVMATLGYWALWTGGFAMAFNYLLGLKHTTEAGAAQDSKDTLAAGQGAQEDIEGFMTGLSAVGIGKFSINPTAIIGGTMKVGRSLLKLITKPGAWAKGMITSGKKFVGMTVAASQKIFRGMQKLYQGGARGIRKLIKKILKLVTRKKVGKWKGPADYSDLIDSKFVGKGKKFTPAQKRKILERNKQHNDGVLRSDLDGSILDEPIQSKSGQKANMSQAEVDHVTPKSMGGSNSYKNAQVLSKTQNLKKSNH